jgi:hypothetical protein
MDGQGFCKLQPPGLQIASFGNSESVLNICFPRRAQTNLTGTTSAKGKIKPKVHLMNRTPNTLSATAHKETIACSTPVLRNGLVVARQTDVLERAENPFCLNS